MKQHDAQKVRLQDDFGLSLVVQKRAAGEYAQGKNFQKGNAQGYRLESGAESFRGKNDGKRCRKACANVGPHQNPERVPEKPAEQ